MRLLTVDARLVYTTLPTALGLLRADVAKPLRRHVSTLIAPVSLSRCKPSPSTCARADYIHLVVSAYDRAAKTYLYTSAADDRRSCKRSSHVFKLTLTSSSYSHSRPPSAAPTNSCVTPGLHRRPRALVPDRESQTVSSGLQPASRCQLQQPSIRTRAYLKLVRTHEGGRVRVPTRHLHGLTSYSSTYRIEVSRAVRPY